MSTGPSQTSACTPPSACSQSASVASPWKASSRRPRAARTVAGSRSAVCAVRNSATAAILSPTGVVFDGDRDQWQPRVRLLDPLTWSADGFQYLDYEPGEGLGAVVTNGRATAPAIGA